MTANNPIKNGAALILAALLTMELASLLTLKLVGIPNIPLPWSFLVAMRYGASLEAIMSIGFCLILTASITGIISGHFHRFVGVAVLCTLSGLVFAFFLGLFIKAQVDEEAVLTISQITSFLRGLAKDPAALKHFVLSELASLAITAAIPILLCFDKIFQQESVLGNAHFASIPETHKAGFFEKREESIIIGKKASAPLYSNGFEHVLVFAPAGSGKTRSIAIPNLFHYPGSVVCNDIKFTLFETTSHYRKHMLGQECFCFAPSRLNTHRYNPLTYISSDKTHRITDIQRIAHILMPDNQKDPIWSQASRKLFKALVLFLLDTDEHPTTLGEINRLVRQQNFDAWLQDILDNTDHLDPEFYRNGYSYINNHHKTRTSILESFTGFFELFDDPIVDVATSGSDFNFNELRKKKITIYVGFSDDDMERLAPLLTLFWQQLISAMIKEIPTLDKEPIPLLCLIDEFSSLGRIERLRRSLKLLREYRVRCILMFQYIAQTYERYSHDEARAFTNIKTKIAFAAEDINDAEFISKMLGIKTGRVVNRSKSRQRHGSSDGTSTGLQAIPLMRPEEIMRLPEKVSLIMRSGHAPVKAGQYIWYKERAMKGLADTPLNLPIQKVVLKPFVRQEILKNSTETACFID